MKIVEELIEIVNHEANGIIDTFRYVSAPGHIERVLTDAAELVRKLEAENEALRKRVVELDGTSRDRLIRVRELDGQSDRADAEIRKLDQALAEAGARISALQSQLAWTPVSAGLPTEPGAYEFYDARATFENQLTLCELLREPPVWQDEEGDEWNQVEFASYVTSTHTHYRRIELPKATS